MNYQQREVPFELSKGINTNKVDEDKLKNIIKDIDNYYDSNNSDLNSVLKELQFYRKNKTNLKLLFQIKNITVCFIKKLKEDLEKYLNEENSKFKDDYSKTIKLKNSKILGSYKNNMYLNNYLNIDVGIEYDIDTKLGKKSKYKNFHMYHNMYINLLKHFFYEKDFIKCIKESNISNSLDICICVNRWTNKIKSVLMLNIFRKKTFIGSIKVLLYPTKKVCYSFSNVYKKYYMVLENIEDKNFNNNNNNNNNSNITGTTEKIKKITRKDGNDKKIDEKEIENRMNKIRTNKIILKNFILTECHIIECEDIIKNAIKNFKGYRKAVKLLKLWCINKKLLHVFKYQNNIKFKNSEKYKFLNFFYHGDINSFILGLLCSYACFSFKLSNCDFFQIFKKTVNFISSINLCECFYEYQNGIYKKSEQKNNSQPHAFLINSIYEIFQNNVCSFIELIEEAKKAEYYLKTNNFFELFLSNNNCFPFNYEEELFFPLLINNNFYNYDEKIGYIKKNLIKSLDDRIEELTFRLVSYDFYEKNSQNLSCNNNKIKYVIKNENNLNKNQNGDILTIFQDVFFRKNKDNEITKNIIKKGKLQGVSFFIKTNNTMRCMDVSKKLYKPEKKSNFRKFWLNKVKIRRFENNTIFEVLMWKKPAKIMNLKKKKKRKESCNEKKTKKSSINKEQVKIKTESKEMIKKKKLQEDLKECKNKENINKRYKSSETNNKKESENIKNDILKKEKNSNNNDKTNYTEEDDEISKIKCNKNKSIEDTGNFVFDALFSELQSNKTNSVHVQIIKYILKTMKFKECYDLKNTLYEKVKYLKTNDHFFHCGKKVKNKSFFVYFTNPLLIKDLYFTYYEIIFEYYNEIKSIIYNINEKLFTISNINSSNNLLKMSDIGYKKNNTKIIDVVIDLKFNSNIYKNAQNFFKNYEMAKIIIKNKLTNNGGSFNKVEQKNFFIDVHYKLIIFRLHIFVSKIIEKNLIQITNLDDVKIDYVENIEKIRNYIYKPLISSFIYFYGTKFSSFHTSLKICKLWFVSKGIYCVDELVENILFYLYTEEFKKHNSMNRFFEDSNLSIYNKSLKNFLLQHKILYMIGNFEDNNYFNTMIKQKHSNNNHGLLTKKNKNNQKQNTLDKNDSEDLEEEETDSDFLGNRENEQNNQTVNNRDNSKNNSKNKKVSSILNLKKDEKEDDAFLDNFSFSSKTILIKFLNFLINYDWINKPLIIDYDGCLSEEHKIKLINSFVVRKKNGEEKKKFWICSIYDPHCVLISLPHNLFDVIINSAKNTLKIIEDLHNNFDKTKWFSLFLIEKRKYDIILHFNQADKALKLFKKKMMTTESKNKKKGENSHRNNETDGSNNKKEEENFEENYINNEKNMEIDENNNIDDSENNIYKMEEIYDLDYLEKIKKTNTKPSDMLHNLKKCELLHIYKNHFDSFIKNLEQNFSSHITILYNSLCFDEVLNTHNFKKKIKRKLNKLPNKHSDILKSWMPYVFITFNPLYINNVEIMSNQNNLQNNSFNSSIALNNFNLLIYYIKNNATDILKDVKFPTI
ncbi:conserved Plasmodium protein, unknown function [Plasmodium gallinaceum]|uniref:Nrap protein domain-containing protein n=1 Tax=Plasmodium gallinaceum TaxID=5849 RepID=A0A1J1GTW4_PLAGA|nr:conserved Plasmodium protein, unknown function [Plasmodium gallinaceum]CRG95737.1 conserved Plasmodium protein, unknown function [Plasmodium gallinaceum]